MKALNIRVFGEGPDLALIHGWGLGSTVWTPLLDRLLAHFRIYLVDLPGYASDELGLNSIDRCPVIRASACSTEGLPGEPLLTPLSSPTPCRTSTGAALQEPPLATADFKANFQATAQAAFADSARGLVDALPAGVTLCGWSLGAMLALQAALIAPDRIARLILLGATPSFTQRADWTLGQPAALLDTFQAALDEHPKATLQRFVALLNQGDAQARTIGRTLLAGLLKGAFPATDALRDGLNFLRHIDLRQLIPSVLTPTLLIHGQHDPLMPLAAAQWLAEHLLHSDPHSRTYPHVPSRLEVFAGSAHAPFLNDPQRFVALLADFCHVCTPH
jgi:pimeloyl-[acyl-carrier protein] methyl ester esterase